MSIAAVILTYNRKELLQQCLDAVLQQSRAVDAIVLVDNASNDGTADAIRDKGYFLNGLVDYVRLEDNVGSAGGFYTGLKHAYKRGYDWFWLLDDDAIPADTTLEILVRYTENHCDDPFGGLLSYQTAWSHEFPSFRLPRSTWEALKYYVACPLESHEADQPVVSLDWCPLVSFLLHRSIVSQIGFPHQDFYLYCDDVDYTLRIRRAGYQLLLIKASQVDHRPGILVNKKANMGTGIRWYYNYRNHLANIIMHREEIGRSCAAAALFRVSLGALRRCVLLSMHQDYKSARLVARAIKDGYALRLGKYPDEV